MSSWTPLPPEQGFSPHLQVWNIFQPACSLALYEQLQSGEVVALGEKELHHLHGQDDGAWSRSAAACIPQDLTCPPAPVALAPTLGGQTCAPAPPPRLPSPSRHTWLHSVQPKFWALSHQTIDRMPQPSEMRQVRNLTSARPRLRLTHAEGIHAGPRVPTFDEPERSQQPGGIILPMVGESPRQCVPVAASVSPRA